MATLAADADQATQEKFAWSIEKDDIYTNGTRLRTFRNGSVAYLGYDLSVINIMTSTAYNFSKSIECSKTTYADASNAGDCKNTGSGDADWWVKVFAERNNGYETDTLYWKVKIFNNNTVWWYLRRCDGATTTSDLVDATKCPTGADTAAKRTTNAYQIDYYET